MTSVEDKRAKGSEEELHIRAIFGMCFSIVLLLFNELFLLNKETSINHVQNHDNTYNKV